MCWACLHPDATWDDYLEHLRSIVSWQGWAIQTVKRNPVQLPRAYTDGLTRMGRPERMVTELAATRAVRLLNEMAEHLPHSGPPLTGEVIEMTGIRGRQPLPETTDLRAAS